MSEHISETNVIFGGEVKALGEGRLGGYLIRFTTEKDPDLEGDFFDNETNFGMDGSVKTAVYYHHGLDPSVGLRNLSSGTLETKDVGVWIETQLQMRDEYEEAIYQLAQEGKLGWSSGTAAHLVERVPVGKAHHITSWPLGLDASLTPTPAEPRNTAMPLKVYQQLAAENPDLEALLPQDTGEVSADATVSANDAVDITININTTHESSAETHDIEPMEVMKMTEELKHTEQLEQPEPVDVAAIVANAADEAIKAYREQLESEKPVNGTGGYATEGVKVTDLADQPFKAFGEQLKAVQVAALSQGRTVDPRLINLNNAAKATGLSEGTPSDGGFLVQTDFVQELLKRTYDTGVISSRVDRKQASPNANGATINYVNETSRATGSRWGGIQGYWLSEAGTKTASKPEFGQMELKLKKLIGLCYATDELLADTNLLGSIITDGFAEEFSWLVDDAVYNGTGAGQPLGVMLGGSLVNVAAEAGQAAATVVAENIFKMWSRMWGRSRMNAAWFINQDVEPQLYQLSLPVGTGGQAVYMPPGGLSETPYATLMGRPVIPVEHAATLGTSGDILLADFSQYILLEKGGIESASSIHVNFVYDETAFRFVLRLDGQPKWVSALTPANSTATQSPFVALATRS